MSLILKEKIAGPAVWRGAELTDVSSWSHRLTESEIDALDSALVAVKASGKSFPNFGREDFLLPTWADKLATLSSELEEGRGFFLMRGFPVDRYTEDEINILYYGIGLNLGTPVRQNPKGDLLGTVMNVGDPNDKETRVYETNAYLPYHTDPSDVVGLLCLQKAKSGGVSSLVSVAAVYNEILEHHPEFLGLFYRSWYYAHLGEDLPSLSPLFSYNDSKLSFRYLRQYIELGHEVMGLPLSRVEREALDLFDSIAQREDLRLDMMLEPGDLQWANNYTVLHSRTGFEDHADPGRRRKKLRLWLKMANARTLAPDFPGRNGLPAPADETAT
ncbi:MAG: TauD/TfdA family dioxygenase [Rhodospirillaceae bacterium]|nr:TauD/TfdA family dioxygenase [Rhodospirillaceae bacterium]